MSGALVNSGTLRKLFGITGVTMQLGALGNLSNLTVDRIDQNHPDAASGLQTGKWWAITPNAGANGTFSATLILSHNGLTDPNVCKWPGGLGGLGWDCARDGFNSATVWRNNLAALSDWAVGSLVGPTAVAVKTFSAKAGSSGGRWLLVLLAALIGAALLRFRLRRADC